MLRFTFNISVIIRRYVSDNTAKIDIFLELQAFSKRNFTMFDIRKGIRAITETDAVVL